jgi:prepilin-type N-terminal cleavage/methylation domain-containing protein
MVRIVTHTPAPRPTRRRAFTLVEVLIVVVVVATIAVAAMPSISATLDSMKATALAREIATDMRYAQILALKTGVRHRVSFYAPGQAYAVRRDNGGSWDLCTHPVTKKPWKAVLDDASRYAGLTMGESQFGSSDYLYYDKFGSPEAGGAVTFTLGGVTRTIRVAPLSGKITVE